MIINYKNFILLLFYWILISNFISASTNGNIYGKVFNTENDSPLVGANVIIINNNIGTATDNKGLYNIKLILFDLLITLYTEGIYDRFFRL